jgi:hypothetical protein
MDDSKLKKREYERNYRLRNYEKLKEYRRKYQEAYRKGEKYSIKDDPEMDKYSQGVGIPKLIAKYNDGKWHIEELIRIVRFFKARLQTAAHEWPTMHGVHVLSKSFLEFYELVKDFTPVFDKLKEYDLETFDSYIIPTDEERDTLHKKEVEDDFL